MAKKHFLDQPKELKRAPRAHRRMFWLWCTPQKFLTRLIFALGIKCLNTSNETWPPFIRSSKAMKCVVAGRRPWNSFDFLFQCLYYTFFWGGVFAQLLMHSFHFVAKAYVVITVWMMYYCVRLLCMFDQECHCNAFSEVIFSPRCFFLFFYFF